MTSAGTTGAHGASKATGAIVTGAASGVGRATCERLGRDGWELTLVDANRDALSAVAVALSQAGVSVRGQVVGDVSDPDCGARAVELCDGEDGALGALVNSAAILRLGSVVDLAVEDWDRVIAVNLRGTFLMMKAALPRLRAHGSGRIVNVASVDAFVAEPHLAAYCASKGGVLMLTRAAAVDHAREGIRINCVCPGAIDTPFLRSVTDKTEDPAGTLRKVGDRHPFGRLLTPEDVADVIAYLVSDRAAAIVGSGLVVDGGLSATWQYA